ncbi:MAG: bifunctional [glutamate--ammonia ligase]-adenylyl-L-tyrosine phosphorylase/[glutamate--ammonia-ligase] adenylyltransferase [Thermodesulfovibrionales bacterium]|nr:bifunctional [glutamate--ammonia ligase]-adenylyl-L-tyrosine phosphorylase/[glutamate--ammonia-ligase] adenylyltransferase [Thermodesulfovibrionales bacterium]
MSYQLSTMSHLPDPERALNNIKAFVSKNPDYKEQIENNILPVSMLFSHSQFLANYCINNPLILFEALKDMYAAQNTGSLRTELRELLSDCASAKEGMKVVRDFRKSKLLVITLRDILKHAGLQEIMLEMSNLADVMLSESLGFVESFLIQRYGRPENNAISAIALGKLGAQELNYSSDIDIIFVYRDEGETSGISAIQNTTINRISAHEYYVKLAEEITRFLSANTEDGFTYRVDLRLRPQGQRGSLALSLRSYEEYYESWGQMWERAMLLRARSVAGDMRLGQEFLNAIRPFTYRKYMDFEAIDEIRKMKSQVEQIKAGTLSSDIKRGYGGIREIEFFIQIFQLIHGGKEPLLRERSTLKALHKLVQKGLIGYDDSYQLSDNYIFFRTIEHRLQQLNDLQTHTLPSGETEIETLGRKMGFQDRSAFMQELDRRRHRVREIYDSLLETKKESQKISSPLNSIFWDMEAPVEDLLKKELSNTTLKDVQKAIYCLMKIRNTIYSFQTIKGRRLLEEILPKFVDEALKGDSPDIALLQLVDFSGTLATKESYLEAIAQRQEIISALTFIFSQSEYLSKIIMSSPEYIESLVEGQLIKKTLKRLHGELSMLAEKSGSQTAVRLFRRSEEVRIGIQFLNKKIGVTELTKGLSKVAEAVIQQSLVKSHKSLIISDDQCQTNDTLFVIGFGKFGGREIIFNSDLDIIFITLNEPSEADTKTAERMLKTLMSYTKEGIAYNIDTRLRPEGTKGPLVSSLKGLGDYYLRNAHVWELQALLKARPITPQLLNPSTPELFMEMRKEVLMKRGAEITLDDIRKMRERIQKELSKEVSGTYDIKLGSGGLEELEFIIQYLQMKNCAAHPQVLVQGTLNAIRRLNRAGGMKNNDAYIMQDTYLFYRTVETILRLRNESVLKEVSETMRSIAGFMDMNEDKFLVTLHEKRNWIRKFLDSMT